MAATKLLVVSAPIGPAKGRCGMCGQGSHHNASELFPPLPAEVEAFSRDLAEGALPEEDYTRFLESICGATDDSQPVEQYDGTLGVSTAFVDSHQRPVGQLQWNDNLADIYTNPGNVAGTRWCTGTLIGDNLFLTAGHCFDRDAGGWQLPRVNGTDEVIPSQEIATNMHVNFNFQVDPTGNPRPEQQFAVVELLEYRLGGLDFGILRLAGNPHFAFGTTAVATADAQQNDSICIIGHPAGVRKRIEAGAVSGLSNNQIRYNDIDTLGGNSGSAVLLSPAGTIVGVHTNGGCTTTGGFNFGVRIRSLLAASPTLRDITSPPFPDWELLDNNPASVGIVASDGALYQLHNNGRIWRYVGPPLTGWQELDNNPATKQIAADAGKLYQIHHSGAIFRYVGPPLTGWQQLDNNPASRAIAAGGGNFYQIHGNGLIWRYTG